MTSHISSSPPAPSTQVPPFQEEQQECMKKAKTITELVLGLLCALGGVGALAIAVTMTGICSEMGASAMAVSALLFGLSGKLLFDATKENRP